MPPRVRIRSAGRPVVELRGGGMGERVGKGQKGRGPRRGNDERVDELNGQGNDQGKGANGNVEGVNGGVGGAPDFSAIIAQQLQNLLPVILAQVEFCPNHEIQKLETELWYHAMVRAGHAAYANRFHELARLVPHLVTLESRKIERYVYDLAPRIRRMVAAMRTKTMQKAVQISSALTDGLLGIDQLRRECRVVPRSVNLVNVRNPTPAGGACHKCGSAGHLKLACPRLNRAQGLGGNCPNQVADNNGGQGHRNQGNQARGR
nr:reverse transcriptase domain-containing protein [Tanacetum cinerariifolium]